MHMYMYMHTCKQQNEISCGITFYLCSIVQPLKQYITLSYITMDYTMLNMLHVDTCLYAIICAKLATSPRTYLQRTPSIPYTCTTDSAAQGGGGSFKGRKL